MELPLTGNIRPGQEPPDLAEYEKGEDIRLPAKPSFK